MLQEETIKKLGKDYFVKNKDLTVDCITVLNAIKDRIQSKLKVNLQQDVAESTTPLFDMDENDNEGEADKKYRSAIQMLSEST